MCLERRDMGLDSVHHRRWIPQLVSSAISDQVSLLSARRRTIG